MRVSCALLVCEGVASLLDPSPAPAPAPAVDLDFDLDLDLDLAFDLDLPAPFQQAEWRCHVGGRAQPLWRSRSAVRRALARSRRSPRSDTGGRGPGAKRRAHGGARPFALLLGRLPKVTRCKSGKVSKSHYC